MKKKHLLFLVVFCLLFSTSSYTQSQKKVIIQSPLDPGANRIIPADIAYGGLSSNASTIGYSFRTAAPIKATLGILNFLENGTIQFSKNYYNSSDPTKVLEIRRVASSLSTGDNIYALAATRTTGDLFMPVIIVLDRITGNLISTHFLNNIPTTDEAFAPLDFHVLGPSTLSESIKILCVGYAYGNPPPGSPYSSLYLIDFNPFTNTYSTTRFYNTSNLSALYDHKSFSFNKRYHYSTHMVGNLSFSGLELNLNFIDRGIVYKIDDNNVQTCRAFRLNGFSTTGIQVNYPMYYKEVVAIQNSQGQFYLDSYDDMTTASWQKSYSSNFFSMFKIVGGNHGSKGSILENTDYITAEYKQPGEGGQGYAFFRYDHNTGNLKQTYSYVSFTDFPPNNSFVRSYYNSSTGKYYFTGISRTNTLQTNQYFYLIENSLDQDQTDCTTSLAFNEGSLPVNIQNINLTSTIISTGLTATTLPLSPLSIPSPVIQNICGDQGKIGGPPFLNREASESTISSTLDKYLNRGSVMKSNNYYSNTQITQTNEGGTTVFNSKSKKIMSYRLYNYLGQQLTGSINVGLNTTIKLNTSGLNRNSIHIVEFLFSDGSKEVAKLMY